MTDGPAHAPHVRMPTETLIMDESRQHQLLRVDGFLPLPVGAEIELTQFVAAEGDAPINVKADVTRVRLSAANGPNPRLVLDVLMR